CTRGRAQVSPPQDSTTKEVVDIEEAEEYRVLNRGDVQLLVGNVVLSQDSVFMYGDSVLLAEQTQVNAYGNVTIQQGDSLAAFSNELDYNGKTKLADLTGDVVLQRGETELYTDRLEYDLTTKLATYHTGGCIVSQTTELTSTHGYYYADRKQVYFRDSVVAIDERFEMRADTLLYDLAAERVYFLGPTVIRTDTHRIYCESGYYDVQLDQAVFSQNAQYASGARKAAADTIKYFGGLREYYVLEGDAYVAEGDFRRATAERINYFRREDSYQLEGNAYLRDSTQTVRGDTVTYDVKKDILAVSGGRPLIDAPPMLIEADRFDSEPETGNRIASGRVVWQDTSANLQIEAANAIYNEATGYLLATGGTGPPPGKPDYFGDRPMLTSVLNFDTMWMVADTLVSVQRERLDTTISTTVIGVDSTLFGDSIIVQDILQQDTLVTTDSIRYLSAFNDVRILKSDLQAVCDSLGFNTIDSVLTLYQDPILWQDTSQLTGDTVRIYFKDEAPDKVRLLRNALVITTPDFIFFNQVKGKTIEALFDSTGLSRTEVVGNAEAIYYILDDAQAYVGVNKTACSAMVLSFKSGSVRKIRFLSAPSGKMDPMKAVNHEEFKLEGFRWEEARKPKTLEDLFRGREGTPIVPVPIDGSR
ncbi:MAG: OstA-like protein, partial [Bacteroidota bacterium]